MSTTSAPRAVDNVELDKLAKAARDRLDAHTYETVQWHFHESTGCPFWLGKAKELNFDPLKEVKTYDDLKKFPEFQDEWLRGGPVRRWVPKPFSDKPIYVFETGGTTGIPKSRINIEDFRTDYSTFSDSLPDEYFPRGSNWLMLGPSGPRRLRLAVEHLAQFRGGICFCIDLDPRWVIKLIKKGWMEHLEAYKQHCIEQAITVLSAGHDIRCMFTTPKLLEALAIELEKRGSSIRKSGITGIFSGGTEFTPQWTRFATEEFLEGVYMTPTYGNTLMGLAASKPVTAEEGYKISYYAPQPRAVIEVVEFNDYNKVVPYGGTGRVKLTTLTREFFVPGFMERDEGEREPPYVQYPWDGVSGVRPFHELAEATTVGVY
ncbi:MAG TPA: hypothetical protein VJ809_14560 [Pirellulales bacterium]|jgi:phenylacetate-coenzyme A ligase PaaK-like adenylate-forming protein|nr:hypothetical protein [Pirellulales bacterium]